MHAEYARSMRRRIVIGLAMLVAILGVVGAFAVPSVTVDPCRVQDGLLPGCTLLPLTQTNNWLRVVIVVVAALLAGALILLARRRSAQSSSTAVRT